MMKASLFVWDLTRVELTTETAWIHPSCSNKQSCQYRLNIESKLQMTNKPNKKFLGDVKKWRIERSAELDYGELDKLECM